MTQPLKYSDFSKKPILGVLAHQGDDGQTEQESKQSFLSKAAEFVAQDIVGESVIPPPARWWDVGRSGRRAEATGTGKQASDVPLWLVDAVNNVQYVPSNNLPKMLQGLEVTSANAGKLGGAVGKFMAPNWIGNRLQNSSGLARGAANIGTSLGVGVGVGVGGELVASVLDDTDQNEKDLKLARFFGDRDLEAKIMDRINFLKTQAQNTRTMSHGIATGSMVGPQGAMVGAGAAGGVVLARTAIGGEKHHVAGMTQDEYDKNEQRFAESIKTAKVAPNIARWSREDVDSFLVDRVARVAAGEKHPDSLKPFEDFIPMDKLKERIPDAFTDRTKEKEALGRKYGHRPVKRGKYNGKGFGE